MRKVVGRALLTAGLILVIAGAAPAQPLDAVEVSLLGGYRFGGGFYELASRQPVDVDGAVSYGVVLNIPFGQELQIEAYVTHQEARFTTPPTLDRSETRWRMVVDHYHVGGLREYGAGRARPFLTGTLGLTRYAAEGDNEVRFSLSAGGGVKLYPTDRVGVRLDTRVFATIVDARGDFLACTPGLCIGAVDVWAIWQAEFSAGVIVRF